MHRNKSLTLKSCSAAVRIRMKQYNVQLELKYLVNSTFNQNKSRISCIHESSVPLRLLRLKILQVKNIHHHCNAIQTKVINRFWYNCYFLRWQKSTFASVLQRLAFSFHSAQSEVLSPKSKSYLQKVKWLFIHFLHNFSLKDLNCHFNINNVYFLWHSRFNPSVL